MSSEDSKNSFFKPDETELVPHGNRIRRVRCEALGTIVSLPEKPQRVVMLVPGLTEAIWEMKLSSRVVGLSAYCGRYVEIGERMVVGDYLRIDEAKLAVLKPDLVVMTGGIQLGEARKLAEKGLPVYVVPLADSFAGILENIRRLGALLGEMLAAHALTHRMEREALELCASAPAVRPRTYVELWCGRFPRRVGGLTYIHDLITIAGGDNIWADAPSGYLEIDLKETAARKPDCVVIFWEADDTLVDAPALLEERGWPGAWPFRMIEAGIKPGQSLIHDGPSILKVARWLQEELRGATA